jgi:phosphohistidine phosphatase
MKTLLLLRHGKSDWSADYGEDRERPLAGRGVKAASLMGRYLAAVGPTPERIVSSTAVRAHDTAKLAAKAGNWGGTVELDPGIYGSGPEQIIKLIQSCENRFMSLLLVGHEPTWSLLTGSLIGGAAVKFPTAAMARIDFEDDSWKDVSFGHGVLAWFVTPRLLKKLESR